MQRTSGSPLPTVIIQPARSSRKDAPALIRRHAIDALLHNGLPYSRKLSAHTSCVNALTFSRDGRWLASAGDDPYVQLWDFNQEDLDKPTAKFSGPSGNVFTLAFSASGQYVYSGDTRNIIHQYDLTHLDSVSWSHAGAGQPSWSDTQHSDSLRAISCHPENDNIFLSAAEDGCIIMHDMRANPQYTRAQSMLQLSSEVTCVQYHPTMTNIFATSDHRGHVCLRDTRMAFGPLSQRREQGVVQKYVTTVAKRGVSRMARPEASSIVFDCEGRRLAVTMFHHFPTLYSLNDPYPIATFSGRHLPDGSLVPPGEKTYANSCTMKHGSFGRLGSDTEMYFASGSDDFRTYVWKVPDEAFLLDRRDVVKYAEWTGDIHQGEIGYASSLQGDRYVPVDLSVPLARLGGHNSITNSALFHPHRPFVLSAGIERYIRLHSPTASSPCTQPLELTPTHVRTVPSSDPGSRELFLRAMGVLDDPMQDDDDLDDSRAIALFDQILRQESGGDVFNIHPWEPGINEMDSSDESVGDEDDEDEANMFLYP